MQRVVYTLLLIAAIAGAFLAGSLRAPRETVSAAGAETARAPLYYQCPMHVDFKSRDRTTPCGLCGMALEPVHAAGGAPDRAAPGERLPDGVLVSTAQQQLIGVRVGTVERASGTEQVRVFGRVTPDETRVYRINVGVDGYVRELSEVTTGSQVAKDQWLATFSAPDARQPIQGFLVTVDVLERQAKSGTDSQAPMDAARAGSEQAVDRLLTLGMSPVQIEEIRRTRLVPPNVRITAPAEGFVLARNVSTGQRLEKGTELFRIADLRRVWILADVAARDAGLIRPGMTAEVTAPGWPTPIRARVSRTVLPQFDATTQSFKLRLEADNPGFVLRPDMFVDVEFRVPFPPSLVIPAEAIVASGLRNTVFVERAAGVFEPREVETGRRHGTRVAVVQGLEPGERIALSGTFLLDSESRMQASDRPRH